MNDTLASYQPEPTGLSTQWYKVDHRGLRAKRVPSWEEWEGGLSGLATLQHALPMIIGDYINVGEDTFGERFEQVLDVFGEYSYGTVANYASICRSVPYERRENGLTMAHYKAIRTLPPEEQVRWQQVARKNNWTSVELWDNVHDTVSSFPQIVDDLIETIGNLFSMSNAMWVDESLSQAQLHLQEAKSGYEKQAESIEAEIT